MYKSPIEIFHKDYMQQYVEQMDNSIFTAIVRNFGADIDREELIKALNYDRNQYEKGFADGVASAQPKWIPVTERLPTEGVSIEMFFPVSQTICLGYYKVIAKTAFWCVNFPDGTGRVADNKPTHWRCRYDIEEFPQPPKGDE